MCLQIIWQMMCSKLSPSLPVLFCCTAFSIIVLLYFGDLLGFAGSSNGGRGLGRGAAQAGLCQLSLCTTALLAQLWLPKGHLWGDGDLETPSASWSRGFSSPSTDLLGAVQFLCVSGADNKGYGKWVEIKRAFSRWRSILLPISSCWDCSGKEHPGHCQCHETITSHYWGQLLCNQRALATTNSGSALSFLPRNVSEPMASVKSCFPMQSPQIFPWFSGLASNFSEFSRTLTTLQITEGKNSSST